MTDIPIIFSAPMILKLRSGEKTQTRRVLKPQPDELYEGQIPKGLKISIGDRIWVKEKYAIVPATAYRMSEGVQQTVNPLDRDMAAVYAAGWERSKPSWKSPMFMPKWASRITLIVTDVRVQRLWDITNEDCIAEGIPIHPNENAPRTGPIMDDFARKHELISHYGGRYRDLWDGINAKRGYAFVTNPWVAAYSFEVIKANINTLEAA